MQKRVDRFRQLAALLFLVVFSAPAQHPPTILVITAGDGWTLGSGHQVTPRQQIPLLADLSATANAGNLLLSCDKAGWLAYACPGHACTVPVCSTSAASVVIKHFDPATHNTTDLAAPTSEGMLASLLRHEPKAPVLLGVREGGRLAEAVVSQTSAGVLWGPMLRGVLEGHYCFRVAPVAPENAPPVVTFNLDWDRENDPTGAGPQTTLSTGLYALQKGKSSDGGACIMDAESAPVWILISPEEAYKTRLKGDWTAYSAQITQLERSGAGPDVVLEMRHAALSYLSDSFSH